MDKRVGSQTPSCAPGLPRTQERTTTWTVQTRHCHRCRAKRPQCDRIKQSFLCACWGRPQCVVKNCPSKEHNSSLPQTMPLLVDSNQHHFCGPCSATESQTTSGQWKIGQHPGQVWCPFNAQNDLQTPSHTEVWNSEEIGTFRVTHRKNNQLA